MPTMRLSGTKAIFPYYPDFDFKVVASKFFKLVMLADDTRLELAAIQASVNRVRLLSNIPSSSLITISPRMCCVRVL